jgi:AcrR family transcriptional regulator
MSITKPDRSMAARPSGRWLSLLKMPARTKRRPDARRTSAAQPARRTQQERSETTTRQIVAAARQRFRRDGYAGTSIDAVVADAGVTKGAFYHHFDTKDDLFEAVFVVEHEELFARILDASGGRARDRKARAFAGFRAFIQGSLDPEVQQVTLIDAPSVLGWTKMREVEGRYGLALLREGIREAVAEGDMRRHDPAVLSHLLQGTLCEGAMYIAREADQKAAARKVERELKLLVDGLFAD